MRIANIWILWPARNKKSLRDPNTIKTSAALNILVAEKIGIEEYNLMKNGYIYPKTKIATRTNDDHINIERIMNQCFDNLIRFGTAYEKSNLVKSRDLIGCVYPENFSFR